MKRKDGNTLHHFFVSMSLPPLHLLLLLLYFPPLVEDSSYIQSNTLIESIQLYINTFIIILLM